MRRMECPASRMSTVLSADGGLFARRVQSGHELERKSNTLIDRCRTDAARPLSQAVITDRTRGDARAAHASSSARCLPAEQAQRKHATKSVRRLHQ